MILIKCLLADQLIGLQKLYQALDGPNWRNSANWDGKDPCNFFGITCTADGTVKGIALTANQLNGTLPFNDDDLNGLFLKLESFDIGYTNVGGVLPPSPLLTKLFAANTHIEYDFAQSPLLTSLSLRYVNYSGKKFPFPIQNFITLNILNCGFVFQTQTVDLSLLNDFHLANNDLSRVTVTQFAQASVYDFVNTQVKGEFDFALYPGSEYALSGTQLIFKNFQLTQMQKVLDLEGCGIIGTLDFSQVQNGMHIMNLKDNNFTGPAPTPIELERMKNLPNLIVLDLQNNPFTCGDNFEGCHILKEDILHEVVYQEKLERIVLISTVGVTKCPYYATFYTSVIGPFIEQYPEIAANVQFEFVSMGGYVPGHSSKSFTMHQQQESLVDVVTLCLQHINYDAYIKFSDCFNQKITVNTCLKEQVPEFYDDTLDCLEKDAREVLDANWKRNVYFGSNGSPTVFAQEKLIPKRWQSASQLKDYICDLPEMAGKC